MKTIGIIPARHGALRFPGKPLAPIGGKAMIEWVVAGAVQARRLSKVVVATEDNRIADAGRRAGGDAFVDDTPCNSGTERVALAAKFENADIIINIQGDEPLVTGEPLDALVGAFDDETVLIASLMTPTKESSLADDVNRVKVVFDQRRDSLYFSRSKIPSSGDEYFIHVGIYAYRADVLQKLVALPQTELEMRERLEQLRWLYAGYKIRMVETNHQFAAVDVPADIAIVEEYLKKR